MAQIIGGLKVRQGYRGDHGGYKTRRLTCSCRDKVRGHVHPRLYHVTYLFRVNRPFVMHHYPSLPVAMRRRANSSAEPYDSDDGEHGYCSPFMNDTASHHLDFRSYPGGLGDYMRHSDRYRITLY